MSDDGKFIAGRDDGHFSDHPDAPFRRHDDYGQLTRRGEEMLQGAASAATTFGNSGASSAHSGGGFGVFLIGLLVVVAIVFDKLLPWLATWWAPWHTVVAVIVFALFIGWKLLKAIAWTLRHPFKAVFRIAVLGLLVWGFQRTVVPLFQGAAHMTSAKPQPAKVRSTTPVKKRRAQQVKVERKQSPELSSVPARTEAEPGVARQP